MRIELSFYGETQIKRDILRVSEHAADMRPAFQAVVERLRGIEAGQFRTEGARGAEPWAPLKAATLAEKLRRGHRPEILRRTDALLRSLTVPGDANARVEITRDAMTFGTRVEYARYHQRGTQTMPRRAVFRLTEADKRDITKTVQRWVISGEL